MRRKVVEALKICGTGIDVLMVNGLKPERVANAITGTDFEGTMLKGWRSENSVTDKSSLPSDIEVIKQRKKDGIDIPLQKNVQAKTTSNYLEYVKFIHNALPELNYNDINTSTIFMKHKFSAPIIIDSMTGGT